MDEEIAEITRAVSNSRPSSKPSTPLPVALKKPTGKISQGAALQSKQPTEYAAKYAAKPRPVLNENEFTPIKRSDSVASVNSAASEASKRSEKASSILQYLEESETDYPSMASLEAPILGRTEAVQLKTELEEAHKQNFTLKAIIERQKARIQERTDEVQLECDHRLATQKAEFQRLTEKNMEFLQSLLKEKEEFLKQQADATRRQKESDRKHLKEVEDLKIQFDRELKKQKDIWQTSEKIRRDNWLKERTKEIKEATARGLEPEIARMMSEHRQMVERLKEQHRTELKSLSDVYVLEKENAIRDARNAWMQEADRRVEQERKTYSDKISELLGRQETEMAEIRRRINDEISVERNKAGQLVANTDEEWQAKLASMEKVWNAKQQASQAEHKACMDETRRKHSCEINRLREEHSAEMTAWLEIQHKKLHNELKERAGASKAELIAERDAELKKVIDRLCIEQIELKKKTEADIASQVKAVTDAHQTEIKSFLGKLSSMKAQLEKAQLVAVQWEAKADELEQEIEDLNNYLGEKDQMINELQSRTELLEKQSDEHDTRIVQAMKKAEEKHEATKVKLANELTAARLELAQLEESHLHELEMLSQREAEGYATIERRVRQTINKKDDKIRELTDLSKGAQAKVQKLEELLEMQRRELAML